MQKINSLASIISPADNISNILHVIASNNESPAYVLLGSKNNRNIYKSGLFRLPKYILQEMCLLGAECFDNLYLEIIHTLRTKNIENNEYFLSFEEIEKTNDISLPETYVQLKSKLNGCYCRIITPIRPLTPKQMIENGYSPSYVNLIMNPSFNKSDPRIIVDICTVTKIKISLNSIFISDESELINNINKCKKENVLFAEYPFLSPDHPSYSSMLTLALKAKKSLDIENQGNQQDRSYHNRMKSWLKANGHDISDNMSTYIGSITNSDK